MGCWRCWCETMGFCQGIAPWVAPACAWFSGPGFCSCPGFHLGLGASDCFPGLAFYFTGPWTLPGSAVHSSPTTRAKTDAQHMFLQHRGAHADFKVSLSSHPEFQAFLSLFPFKNHLGLGRPGEKAQKSLPLLVLNFGDVSALQYCTGIFYGPDGKLNRVIVALYQGATNGVSLTVFFTVMCSKGGQDPQRQWAPKFFKTCCFQALSLPLQGVFVLLPVEVRSLRNTVWNS